MIICGQSKGDCLICMIMCVYVLYMLLIDNAVSTQMACNYLKAPDTSRCYIYITSEYELTQLLELPLTEPRALFVCVIYSALPACFNALSRYNKGILHRFQSSLFLEAFCRHYILALLIMFMYNFIN